jgi:hypothetical protein
MALQIQVLIIVVLLSMVMVLSLEVEEVLAQVAFSLLLEQVSFQTTIINFMNYSNTSTYKTLLARGNDTAASTAAITGLWQSTSAINTVKILGFGGNNLDAGSTFTLYGIKAE